MDPGDTVCWRRLAFEPIQIPRPRSRRVSRISQRCATLVDSVIVAGPFRLPRAGSAFGRRQLSGNSPPKLPPETSPKSIDCSLSSVGTAQTPT